MEKHLTGLAAFESLLSEHTEQLNVLRRSLRNAPRSVLMVSREKGKPVFYRVICENGEYSRKRITGKEQQIYRSAHRKYKEELLRRKEHNNELLARIRQRLLPEDPQSVISALPKGYGSLDYSRIVDPSAKALAWPNPSRDDNVFPERARLRITDKTPEEWASEPYCENTKELANKTHRSRRGICCRSKGEAMLLDLVDDMNLRYRYDSTVLIEGYEISPDLIIARPDGKLIYVEHHGWIDKDDGDRNFLYKLSLYSRIGIIQGYNLLVTFDRSDSSCDTELIHRQLENMLTQPL